MPNANSYTAKLSTWKTTRNKKETVNANIYVQLHVDISACSFHVHTMHAHECTREAPRVGIDGPVNTRAVHLVD